MEIIAIQEQEVLEGQNVLFTATPIPSTNRCIIHREGSGLIKLRGLTKGCQCKARFLVEFNGNLNIPTDGTAPAEISVAISLDGEPIGSSIAAVTPPVVNRYFNVSSVAYIDVPAGCCANISIRNTSTQSINVRNANLVVSRIV